MCAVALRAAHAGKTENGARIADYADACFVAKKATREPNETRARTALQELLSKRLRPEALGQLMAEGTRLTEREACRLALED